MDDDESKTAPIDAAFWQEKVAMLSKTGLLLLPMPTNSDSLPLMLHSKPD